MRKKESRKKDGEIGLLYQSVSCLWHTLRYIHVCQLLGSIILSAFLVWELVGSFLLQILVSRPHTVAKSCELVLPFYGHTYTNISTEPLH